MKTAASKANNLGAIGVLLAIVPFIGWALACLLILVSFILSVVSLSKDEKGAARAMVSSILAVPCAVLLAFVGLAILGGL